MAASFCKQARNPKLNPASQQPLTFGDARTARNPDDFKVFVEIQVTCDGSEATKKQVLGVLLASPPPKYTKTPQKLTESIKTQ